MDARIILDVLSHAFQRGGDLVAVREHRFEGDPKLVTRVDLAFEKCAVAVVANGDDDTISLELELPDQDVDATVHDVTNDTPWSDKIGKPLLWGWAMINQQGYEDGIQLEFAETVEDQSRTIQLMVIGSSIEYRDVMVRDPDGAERCDSAPLHHDSCRSSRNQ